MLLFMKFLYIENELFIKNDKKEIYLATTTKARAHGVLDIRKWNMGL